MEKQSTVILRTEQHLVEVMISTSITMPTLTKARIVFTLAAPISHQLGISIALNKPSRCLLVAATSHQQKLTYFTEQLRHSTRNANLEINIIILETDYSL